MANILTDPLFYELYERCCESPELDRIVADMNRHVRAGRYDRERCVRAMERYVVEPSAIALAPERIDDSVAISPRTPRPTWFTVYPRALRAEVAERILRTWEHELRVKEVSRT